MSKMQRTKGKVFERAVANLLRKAFPGVTVRRASQAERAANPDVFFADSVMPLSQLWCELTDSINPNPVKKLEQAERDIRARFTTPSDFRYGGSIPVCIWHRLRERTIYATLRLSALEYLATQAQTGPFGANTPVTMDVEDFLRIVAAHHNARQKT